MFGVPSVQNLHVQFVWKGLITKQNQFQNRFGVQNMTNTAQKYETGSVLVWNRFFGFQTDGTKLTCIYVWILDTQKFPKSKLFYSVFRHCLNTELFDNWTIMLCPKSKPVRISALYCIIGLSVYPRIWIADTNVFKLLSRYSTIELARHWHKKKFT